MSHISNRFQFGNGGDAAVTRAPVIMAARDAAVRALLASVGLQGLGAKFAENGIDDCSKLNKTRRALSANSAASSPRTTASENV